MEKKSTRIMLLVAVLTGILIGAIAIVSSCANTVDRDALAMEAKAAAEKYISNYPYESFDITFDKTYVYKDVTYYYYNMTIGFGDDTENPYEKMWSALTTVSGGDYQLEYFREGDMVFREYATYRGKTYEIDCIDPYVLDCTDDWRFEYVTASLKTIEVPYVGMSEDLIKHTQLGKPYERTSKKSQNGGRTYYTRTYYFYADGGTTEYKVVCKNNKVTSVSTSAVKKKSSSSSKGSSKSDPYNASSYSDADDFYYYNKDDFYDYEEAEAYYKKHKND